MSRMIQVEETFEVPDGNYHVKILKVDDFTGLWDKAFMIFFLLDPKSGYEGVVNGIFPAKVTAKNKTGSIIKAAFGECEVGRTYDIDALVNKKLWVEVKNETKEGSTFPRVKRGIWPPPGQGTLERGEGANDVAATGKKDYSTGGNVPEGMEF